MPAQPSRRPALVRTGLGWRLPALAVVLGTLALGAGCAGIVALASWAAAASTVNAIVNYFDPSHPTYTLSGYVYLDNAANTIAVESAPTPPASGSYQPYTSAPMFLDTTPPMVTTSNSLGYFQFTGISESQSTYILTITTPAGTKVQYTVNLATPSITPLASS